MKRLFLRYSGALAARQRAGRDLEESERRYKHLAESSLGLICTHDLEGRLLWINAAAAQSLGQKAENAIGRSIREALAAPVQEKFPAYLDRIQRNGSDSGFMRVVTASGEERVWMYRNVLWKEPGKAPYVRGHALDVTELERAKEALRKSHEALEQRVARRTAELETANEKLRAEIAERHLAEIARKQLERQLRHAQKMEAVGRLAGGLAHDFNNLLTAIGGYSDLLLDSLDPRSPLRGDVGEIKKAGARAAVLIRQLLAFSRKQVLNSQVLDLNEVIAEMEKILRTLAGESIELAIAPAPEPARVKADRSQVEQVILNLAVNARDAMPEGGRLTIEIAGVEQAPVDMPAGPCVCLTVSDTGCGMDPDTRSRIFEPFFTTKQRGQGTGLGLSTAYGIIQQTGGHILVESEPGQGSAFRIYLPRVSDAAAPDQSRRAGTVLLVEDEDGVRTLVRRGLERNGYDVLEARNGGEALSICERHSGPIQLMVTDVVMPGMNGRELAERLAGQHPHMKVLFVSGYTDGMCVEQAPHGLGAAFLQKPFRVADLARAVGELMTQPGRSVTTE